MARELGPLTGYKKKANHMLRVIPTPAAPPMVKAAGYEALEAIRCRRLCQRPQTDIVARAKLAWTMHCRSASQWISKCEDKVVRRPAHGPRHGLRHPRHRARIFFFCFFPRGEIPKTCRAGLTSRANQAVPRN